MRYFLAMYEISNYDRLYSQFVLFTGPKQSVTGNRKSSSLRTVIVLYYMLGVVLCNDMLTSYL